MGWKRSETTPPRTEPMPAAVRMVAQAPAPPRDSFATSGPSTKNGARTVAWKNAKLQTLAQTHVLERNSRHPARSSCRKLSRAAARARPAGRIRARNQALARNEPASTASA